MKGVSGSNRRGILSVLVTVAAVAGIICMVLLGVQSRRATALVSSSNETAAGQLSYQELIRNNINETREYSFSGSENLVRPKFELHDVVEGDFIQKNQTVPSSTDIKMEKVSLPFGRYRRNVDLGGQTQPTEPNAATTSAKFDDKAQERIEKQRQFAEQVEFEFLSDKINQHIFMTYKELSKRYGNNFSLGKEEVLSLFFSSIAEYITNSTLYSPLSIRERIESKFAYILEKNHPSRTYISFSRNDNLTSDNPSPAENFTFTDLEYEISTRIYDLDFIKANSDLLRLVDPNILLFVFTDLNSLRGYSCLGERDFELSGTDISVKGCPTEYYHHIKNEVGNSTFSQVVEPFNQANRTIGTSLLIEGFAFKGGEYDYLTKFFTDNDRLAHHVKFTNCTFSKEGVDYLRISRIRSIEWLVFERCSFSKGMKYWIKQFGPIEAFIVFDLTKSSMLD